MPDSLSRYNEKRDFTRTAEPEGKVAKGKGFHYLIQKHAATRLHYDFRLELDGVLKSWAVTRGPSLNPADKRLAVETEDHPVSYGSFEGTIPKGEYGGGTVMLWDQGTWEPIGDPHEGLKKGDLKFKLHGERLGGSWALIRMKPRPQDRGRNNWLLIKHQDEVASEDDAEAWLESNASSIVSGRSMDDIADGKSKVWHSGKAENTLSFIEPELATLADKVPSGEKWVHEVKFDGYRLQALIEGGEVRLLTRTGLDWTPKFAGIARLLQKLKVGTAILDGEVVALDSEGVSSFKTLQDSLRDGHSDALQYYVFDLMHQDGEDLTRLPLIERKARLEKLLKGFTSDNRINYSEHFTEQSGFVSGVCDLKLEGLISKRADAVYASGRARTWLKIKCHKRQEFVIGGFKEPTHAARGIGALMLGYYEDEKFVFCGKCGTGFDHETSVALRKQLDELVRKTKPFDDVPAEVRREAVWVEPKLVCEIEFTEWTPDGRLRHPSFQGLRADKPAKEVGRDRELPVETVQKEAKMEVAEAKPGVRSKAKNGKVDVGGIGVSSPDRIIYPGTQITKLDLAQYYLDVADHILPFVANRPLSMLRCPEGIGEACFFQRHISAGQSEHIYETGIPVKGRDEDYLMIKDAKGLISLVQWGVIELHPWGCRVDKPDRPDRLIFDLDPDPGVPWERVVAAAFEVRDRMGELGLGSFLKTTGGKGLHVCVPIDRDYGWPTIKAFARAVAQSMEHDAPDRFIATMSKEKRKGRIFVDYLRNELTATAVTAFSVRARPGAYVSTPLDWKELSVALKPSDFDIDTVRERVKQGDPWRDFFKVRQMIKREYLEALRIEV
ncbi:DNA ligase [Asticcacaulis sp. AC460]|uniref:DNA ligase D n=1 Tax=Asticcacaulis sp. AC460 TaxID=1282360 RepID=UPI0003C3BB20|nr:DNA ligase D [Asticcacaulis sp. AC460]ESQ93503.1 DNA ligase [Asticcacaulis sp. AC460]